MAWKDESLPRGGRLSVRGRKWDEEHRALLERIAPEEFEVLHYAALAVLGKKMN